MGRMRNRGWAPVGSPLADPPAGSEDEDARFQVHGTKQPVGNYAGRLQVMIAVREKL
jgi:hypothetical protein